MNNQTSSVSLSDQAAYEHTKMLVDACAGLAHNANRAYCKSIGDHTQLPWEQAPEWQKESARQGVAFHLSNPDAGPSGSHESWMRVKTAEGWQFGPHKDPEAKTHPCFLPYEQLPEAQKMKDYIFTYIVHGFFTE